MSPPSLAVVCVTQDPPARVAAILADLAPLASEVLIGVDRRVPDAALGPYTTVADRVFRFDAGRGADVVRNWLLDRATSEWAFVLDGDEVPSSELLDRLPALLTADVGQHVVARRWCWPDVDTWLWEQPWWPDFQVRLLRRGRWREQHFGVLPHESVRTLPPVSFQLAPIYHLDAVLTPYADRVAKAQRYEARRPGVMAPGGDPLNATMFAPEDHASGPWRPTPADDVERLRRVLALGWDGDGPGPGPGVEVVDARELDRYFPELALAGDAYAVALRAVDQELRAAPGEVWNLYVEVENRGGATLPGGGMGHPKITLSYHLHDDRGALVVADGPRTPLPAPLAPGQVAVAPLRVDAPPVVGRYVLAVDLVHDGVRWFGCEAEVPLEVGPRRSAH